MLNFSLFCLSFLAAAVFATLWSHADSPTSSQNESYLWPDRAMPIVVLATTLIVLTALLAEKLFEPATSSLLRWLEMPSVTAIWTGATLAALGIRNAEVLKTRGLELWTALLGGEKSAWALQIATGLLLIVGIVAIVNPNLFERLSSVKAGDVEAHFSEISSATREAARGDLIDIARENTIYRYIDFEQQLSEPKPRWFAAKHFDSTPDAIKDPRSEVRKLFFNVYLSPFARAVDCMYSAERNEQVHRDPELLRLALFVRSHLLDIDGPASSFTTADWKDLLDKIAALTLSFEGELAKGEKALDRECKSIAIASDQRRPADAETLASMSCEAAKAANKDTDLKSFKLVAVDPYLVAAAADLVALTMGDGERAKFIAEVTKRYPADPKYLSPGIVNLHFQLVDAELKGVKSWPFRETMAELDMILDASEYYIGKGRLTGGDDFEQTFMLNEFVFASSVLDAVSRRRLAGLEIEPSVRRRWAKGYMFLQSVLSLRGAGANTRVVDADPPTFSERDAKLWATLEPPDDYLFDAYVSMALTAATFDEREHVTMTACETANYYLDKAKESSPNNTGRLSIGGNLTLQGFLAQIAARIKVVCR